MEPKRGRKELMAKMKEADPFFKEFGLLDDKAFEEGVIPKKYKELSMIGISIQSRCEECIEFHISEAVKAGAKKAELLESIRMGMMAGGSLTYPYVRHAFDVLMEAGVV